MLSEWTELQAGKYQEARQNLLDKWENASVRTRYKELEYSLKMQQKRLQLMITEFAAA